MTKSVSRVARKPAEANEPGALLQSWRHMGIQPADAGHFPPLANAATFDLPPIVANLDAAQIASRIAAWRAANRQLDVLFLQATPPADALRRFGLTHWAAGNPRAASLVLATAAAMAPNDAALWVDLGSTLHAAGDAVEARSVFERALALNPAPARAWLALALVANALSDKRRAEEAFKAALARDPKLGEAAFGLGLLCFERRRYAEAARHWRQAIAAGCQNALVHAGLGQALFFTGDFSGASHALKKQIASGTTDPKLIERFALARFVEAMIAEGVEAAFAAYREAADPQADDPNGAAHTAFQILSAYGHRDAALKLGRALLAKGRDDPIQRYLVDAVAGEKLERAPRDYLVAYFDRFAESFDKQLVDVLGYQVPERLAQLVAAAGKDLPRAVDLGCGTGLAGPHLRAARSRLVGVDLSPRMLAKAADRRVYDSLVETDMVAFLEETSERFDLVFAADTIIYLGDLTGFFSAAARVTPTGAILAFNVETTWDAPYLLLPSGRFAHTVADVQAMAAPWFALKTNQHAVLRIEANARVHGSLILMERS
ncbi:MAG: tetratricopeptide repeat protein [Roseiarcus sp.]